MGLQYKKTYENQEDLKTLRYGKLMIMTDQDQVLMVWRRRTLESSFANENLREFYILSAGIGYRLS